MALLLVSSAVFCKKAADAVVTSKVEVYVKIGGEELSTPITLGLFGQDTPKTATNFLELSRGGKKNSQGKQLTYAGSPFHRII